MLYKALPRQHELHTAPEPYVLYGGAAGGAKSLGLRMHGLLACLANADLRVLLLRQNFTELQLTHITSPVLGFITLPSALGTAAETVPPPPSASTASAKPIAAPSSRPSTVKPTSTTAPTPKPTTKPTIPDHI